MVFKVDEFEITLIGSRKIVVKGVARMFYESGFPISIAIDEFKSMGIEVSLLHVADQCWDNGWSPETIIKKLKGECGIDINKSMSSIDWSELEYFCNLLDQPNRSNGGYEESREMLFKYLFGCSHEDVRSGLNTQPLDWLNNVPIKTYEKQFDERDSRKNPTRNKRQGKKKNG